MINNDIIKKMNIDYNDDKTIDMNSAIYAMKLMKEAMNGIAEKMNITEDDVSKMVRDARKLLNALKEGRKSGEKEGYISLEELRKKYS